ncbi:aldo/keto reductase [Pseudomaricurvus alkylphenolicus]|nr:aldo/keto reductase [Pseudomaricurvus alkylphenolicus]
MHGHRSGGGILSGKYQNQKTDGSSRFDLLGMSVSQAHQELLKECTRIAKNNGCTFPQLALTWIRQANGRTIPIIGASKASQLTDNLKALEIKLTQNEFEALEIASRQPIQEPYNILSNPHQLDRMYGPYKNSIANTRQKFPISRKNA